MGTAMRSFLINHRTTARSWGWAMCGTSCVLALFMLAGYLDGQAQMLTEAAVHKAWIQGFKTGEASMLRSAETAWQAAQEEANHCAALRQAGTHRSTP